MAFKLLILHDVEFGIQESVVTWPDLLRQRIPGIDVHFCTNPAEALGVIGECDAAFGNIEPELFARADKLRWIASPHSGPPAGYYHPALVASDVVVTNTRTIHNDHIGIHAMTIVLALAKGLHTYIRRQVQGRWEIGYDVVHLPEATAVIVGVGGIGGETARLCSELGMTVLGVDPRVSEPPKGVIELHRPDAIDQVLARGDFVIVTAPETPQTLGLFNIEKFRLMKKGAFFINVSRGGTTVLDDLVQALQEGEIRGAGLDVFDTEPLPAGHPLWDMESVIITPHVAGNGPYLEERRAAVFLDNCVRFSQGRPLRNVVDKANWF